MANFMAGRRARRTVPYRALTAYWESQFRWLVDPPTTGVDPGSVGEFSLDRRWQPQRGVHAAKFGIDVTPDAPEPVGASAWYSQKTMEAQAGGGASHASLTLRLKRRSRRNAGAVLAIPGGEHVRLLHPNKVGARLHQLISADPKQWDPAWCLVNDVWISPKLPGRRVLVGSASTSVSIEGAAGMTGVNGGTLSGGRVSQVVSGADEEILAGCAVMLTCWRIADPWIKVLGKRRWSPGIFVDISIMLLFVPNCQVGARNPLGLSCRADVVSGRDCNIARCSQTRRS